MPILPSIAHVARAIARSRSPDDWDKLPAPEQSTNLKYARVALDAVWSWYQERRNTSNRYFIEPIADEKDRASYAIYDKNIGSTEKLGVVHDALLAQQIVDDLNKHDAKADSMPKAPSGD